MWPSFKVYIIISVNIFKVISPYHLYVVFFFLGRKISQKLSKLFTEMCRIWGFLLSFQGHCDLWPWPHKAQSMFVVYVFLPAMHHSQKSVYVVHMPWENPIFLQFYPFLPIFKVTVTLSQGQGPIFDQFLKHFVIT